MTYKCDNCGSTDTYVKNNHNKFIKNGYDIEFDSEERFCKKCDCSVYDRELDNITLKKAIQVYNRQYGISEDIKKIRKEIGLSLDELANIIGCAKKTLISYEKGESIPNDTYLIIIKTILDNPESIKLLIRANRNMFEDKKLIRIEKKLNDYYANNSKGLFLNKETEASEYNGFTEIDIDKLINIITILSNKGINKTKLLKELFYIDFLSYKTKSCSITGLEYTKLPYGPVVDDFEKIFDTLTINNIIDYNIKYNNNYEEHIIKSKVKPNFNIFRKEELDIINTIQDYFKDFNVKEIEEYSHKENAYTKTKLGDKISYEYAFDINLL